MIPHLLLWNCKKIQRMFKNSQLYCSFSLSSPSETPPWSCGRPATTTSTAASCARASWPGCTCSPTRTSRRRSWSTSQTRSRRSGRCPSESFAIYCIVCPKCYLNSKIISAFFLSFFVGNLTSTPPTRFGTSPSCGTTRRSTS